MKRRGFFRALTAAAAASGSALAATDKKDIKLKYPDDLDYAGFNIKWTGWKPSMQSAEMAGQWVAKKANDEKIVCESHPWGADIIASSFPGIVSHYVSGDHFAISRSEKQRVFISKFNLPNPWASEKFRIEARRMALDDLKDFIRSNH